MQQHPEPADVQLLIAAVVDAAVELNVALLLLCLPNILYHVLRVLGNLVDKDSYHVLLIFVHGTVFYRIVAVILYFFFVFGLPYFGVVAGVVVLRSAEQLLLLPNLEGIEFGGRLVDRILVGRQGSVAWANSYYTDTHHPLLYSRRIDVVDGFLSFGVEMRNTDNLLRISFGIDSLLRRPDL